MLLVVVALAGCSREPEPLLRVGINQWPGYELLHLADTLGYYDYDNIRMVELSSNTEVLQALHNGTLPMGALTLDEAISEANQGTDLRIVAVFDYSNGADALLVHPGIRHLTDLKGKRIGVESAGVGAILLDGALQAAGLTIDDVTIVPLTWNQHREAWQEGRVDAVVTFEPATTRLRKMGAKVLFDSSRIPGRIVDVLVVRADALAAQHDNISALLTGYFRAFDYFRAQPRAAVERMAPRLQVSPDDLQASYRSIAMTGLAENRRLLAGDHPALAASLRQLVQLMLRQDLLEREPDYGQMIDGRFLPARAP